MTHVYDIAKDKLAKGTWDPDTDALYVCLVMTNTTADTETGPASSIADFSDFSILDLCDGSGYDDVDPGTWQSYPLTGLTTSAAAGYTSIDANDLVFTAISLSTRQITGAILYLSSNTTGLANQIPIAYYTTGDFNATGSDITIQWASDGIVKFS